MKWTAFLIAFLLMTGSATGQLLKLHSKDSLNGLPKKEFYTTAWVKMNAFYDFQGIPNESSMHLPSIPTEREGIAPDPQFHADLNQTRVIFATAFQTRRLGEIMSYIETDFFGNGGGGLRLRHAYARFMNFRIGQTWSGFTDEESWPNITDFDGPSTGAWVRSAQIAYFIRPTENQDIMVSIEQPLADFSRYLVIDTLIRPARQSIPDFVAHYEVRWPKGHFQIGGVYRDIEYKNAQTQEVKHLSGWGFNLSGTQSLFNRDKFTWQFALGEAIARYLVSFGGGGWDAVPNSQGDLLAVPVWGGYFGYQLFWWQSKNQELEKSVLSSTFVYGYVNLQNPLAVPSSTLLTGHYASANVYYNIVGPLNFALEGIYGFRTDEFESTGDNFRLAFVMEYNF